MITLENGARFAKPKNENKPRLLQILGLKIRKKQPRVKSMWACQSSLPPPPTPPRNGEDTVAECRILHTNQFINTNQCSVYGVICGASYGQRQE